MRGGLRDRSGQKITEFYRQAAGTTARGMVSEIKHLLDIAILSLLLPPISPRPSSSSKPLQPHACLHTPSGSEGIVFGEGATVPASYAD